MVHWVTKLRSGRPLGNVCPNFVFILCGCWGLINRIYQLLENHPLPVLTFCEAVFNPLCGALNALVYGVSQKVFTRIKGKCCGCPGDKMMKETDGREDSTTTVQHYERPNSGNSQGTHYGNSNNTFRGGLGDNESNMDEEVFLPSPNGSRTMRPLLSPNA